MARSYGRTATSMWRDPDFLDLPPEARFVYSMLFNQDNITPCGVLGLTLRRFARNTGYTVDVVQGALDELVKRDYIVLDEDTEEVFVRSFVKHDGGLGNDLRRKAILASADAVASVDIRASIAHQLDRLGVQHGLSIGPRDSIETRRVVVNEGDYENNPQPTTRNPEPESRSRGPEPYPAAASDGPPAMFCSKHPDGTEEPCGPCADARRRYADWSQRKLEREVETRRARTEAIANCELCDDKGMRLDPDTAKPIGRCNHHEMEPAS